MAVVACVLRSYFILFCCPVELNGENPIIYVAISSLIIPAFASLLITGLYVDSRSPPAADCALT